MLTLVPEAIERYAHAHTAPAPDLLRELQAETEQVMGRRSQMLSGPIEGALLQFLIASLGARRVLEIGTFTGYSALMMAAALPEGGRLITCDVNPDALAIAGRYFARSPYGSKIEVREGPALETIGTLTEPLDLVFIDADKTNYLNYYEAVLPRLAERGVIAVDNVLWSGRVLDPKEDNDRAIAGFNDRIHNDPRVTNVILTVRDGLMLIRRAT